MYFPLLECSVKWICAAYCWVQLFETCVCCVHQQLFHFRCWVLFADMDIPQPVHLVVCGWTFELFSSWGFWSLTLIVSMAGFRITKRKTFGCVCERAFRKGNRARKTHSECGHYPSLGFRSWTKYKGKAGPESKVFFLEASRANPGEGETLCSFIQWLPQLAKNITTSHGEHAK